MANNLSAYVDGKLRPEYANIPIISWCRCRRDKGHSAGTIINPTGKDTDIITCNRCGGTVLLNGKEENYVREWDDEKN